MISCGHSDECRPCHSGNRRWAPPSLPAICHFHWGHLRRTAGAGNMGRYRGCFLGGFFVPFLWVGFSSRFIAATIYAHACFLVRFYAQQHRLNGHFDWRWSEEILKEDKKGKERRGGQALVEVVVCAVGRVVILPLVEMTAQSTALLALVTYDGGVKPDQLYCL